MLKIINNLTIRRNVKSLNKISSHFNKTIRTNYKYSQIKQFNTSALKYAKYFVDVENKYAYNILHTYHPSFVVDFEPKLLRNKVENVNDFNHLLQQHWRTSSPANIVQAFKSVVDYCNISNTTLSDERFNNLVDGLMDNVEKLSYEEILDMLTCLTKFPQAASATSHNFHDIWTALDDICFWRMSFWNIDQLFQLAELWYKLNLGKLCNYIYEFLNKFETKADKLSKEQLVLFYFYLNICRRRKVAFETESALQQKIIEMNVDEMAIVAMGHFKTQTKIKSSFILECMIKAIVDNQQNIHELSLCALLKIIRYSQNTTIGDKLYGLLDSITPEIHRLSIPCCLHVVLLGTTLQLFHEPSLKLISEKFIKSLDDTSTVRLKDIERILVALSMFDYDPKTNPDIYESILKELHKESRLIEMERHSRCLPNALAFLAIRNIYSEELINKVLNKNFLKETYGKSASKCSREILFLDLSTEIELPNYKGNRIDLNLRYRAAKYLTEFVPAYNQYKKLSAADKLMLNVINIVADLVGKENIFIHHVLPHFPKADIVLCKDKKSEKFVVPKSFENYILGDINTPFDTTNFDWYDIVVIGWNATIRNTSLPVGFMNTKQRQLRAIGYKPVLIIWNEFMPLNEDDKKSYVLNKIKKA